MPGIRRTHFVIVALLIVVLALLAIGSLRGSAPLRTMAAAGASAERAVRSVAGPVAATSGADQARQRGARAWQC